MTSVTSSTSRVITDSPVVVALDYNKRDAALAFVDGIDPRDCRLKVGKEMFTLFGPQIVRDLQQRGFDVFLDLKFHDIPNTVAKAVAASAELGVWMVNVHASGGLRMMTAAKEALQPYGERAPHLIAVTVLTSMEQDELALLRRQGTVPPRSLFCRVQSVPFLVGENWLFGFLRRSGGGG